MIRVRSPRECRDMRAHSTPTWSVLATNVHPFVDISGFRVENEVQKS